MQRAKYRVTTFIHRSCGVLKSIMKPPGNDWTGIRPSPLQLQSYLPVPAFPACLSACGQSSLLAPGTYSSSSQLFRIPNNIVESFLLVKGLMVFLQHLPVFQLPLVQYLCGSLQPFFRIPVENFLELYCRSVCPALAQSLVKLPVPALCILGSQKLPAPVLHGKLRIQLCKEIHPLQIRGLWLFIQAPDTRASMAFWRETAPHRAPRLFQTFPLNSWDKLLPSPLSRIRLYMEADRP